MRPAPSQMENAPGCVVGWGVGEVTKDQVWLKSWIISNALNFSQWYMETHPAFMGPWTSKQSIWPRLNIYCTETCSPTWPHSQAFKFIMKTTRSNCIILIEKLLILWQERIGYQSQHVSEQRRDPKRRTDHPKILHANILSVSEKVEIIFLRPINRNYNYKAAHYMHHYLQWEWEGGRKGKERDTHPCIFWMVHPKPSTEFLLTSWS